MKTKIIKSESRGRYDYGWLKTNYSFSFSNYFDPERIHFGALRVLNNDIVAPGTGFSKHPHDNMEIITIPLQGSLKHSDSMGNTEVIESGEIQVMSAGTGVFHSEENSDNQKELELFQIWIFTKIRDVEPRYQTVKLPTMKDENKLVQILSPNKEDEGVWIYQEAWFHWLNANSDFATDYRFKKQGNGVYLMIVYGQAEIAGEILNQRDAIEITETDSFSIKVLKEETQVLIMEIPMKNFD